MPASPAGTPLVCPPRVGRPAYAICPGDRLEVEVVQPDGGRALVVGKLDAVPEAAGGRTLRIRLCDAHITALPAHAGRTGSNG